MDKGCERWDFVEHSREEFIKGYSGWIKLYDLPLKHSTKQSFEVSGTYLGGLEEVSLKTLNLIDCLEVLLQVKDNLCDFFPASIEIKDPRLGSFKIQVPIADRSELPLKEKVSWI